MTEKTTYHQLGKFIVYFQNVESEIKEIIELLVNNTDRDMVRILINELGYFKRLETVDVMFARFVEVHQKNELIPKKFHKLIVKLKKLGERRNDLVHSVYISWYNAEGLHGVVREHSVLSGRKGLREKIEEKLLPEALDTDLDHIETILTELSDFRLQLIDWLYPDVNKI